MKGRTARRLAIWRWNSREARSRPESFALPCVERQYNRDVRRSYARLRMAKGREARSMREGAS